MTHWKTLGFCPTCGRRTRKIMSKEQQERRAKKFLRPGNGMMAFLVLDSREQSVIIDRLLCRPPKTFKEIGKKLKRSPSRADQIFHQAMRKWGIAMGNDQFFGGFVETRGGALLRLIPPTIGNRYWSWGWFKDPDGSVSSLPLKPQVEEEIRVS